MKRLYLLSTLVLTLLAGKVVVAQDFSNKGKDFWVAYGYHQQMYPGQSNGQDMVLYFATDVITTVTVSIPGLGYSQTYPNIPAGTVFASNPIPKSFPDARLTVEGLSDKGIHVTSDHAIVAYAHIYYSSVSGASILYPTNTLGREYYSVNYTNISNITNANCWFYVVATDSGTTKVEITPSAATTAGWVANTTYTVSLTQGQVYNVMGTTNGNNGVDLTGSTIKSISTGTEGCKKIAVFSGSGRIAISCNGTAPSSDNYMVQALPKTAWGKRFLTVPTANYTAFGGTGLPLTNNIYRICVQDPTTIVTVNGLPIVVPLINNFYYEISATSQLLKIDANKPIMVAQYLPSQTACGAGSGDGDPEVIYLSPVEQSINTVRWNACHPYAINPAKNWINVIIPSGGTAITSLKLDGAPFVGFFSPHPQDPNYSYAVINVTGTSVGPGVPHTIQSDSGFNAIAYGYGNAESYGYNAGTNIRDLYQFVSIKNQYATVDFPATCKNAPFFLSMTFPYEPTQIIWDFGGLFPNDTIVGPAYDSTWILNGRQLYRYKLTSPFTISTPGTYPIKVFAQNPTPEGCSGEQEIDYDLQVFEPPHADFTFSNSGCASDTVYFTDAAVLNGRTAIKWNWAFGDGGIDSIKNTKHKYLAQGSYNVTYSVITDIGCISDTATKMVTLSNPPIAKFGVSFPECVGKLITFTDTSSANAGGTLVKWYWNFGDGSPQIIATTNAAQTHTYAGAGPYFATLKVETATGCQSFLFTLPVNLHANPVANFSLPNMICSSAGAQFNDQSTISDGTQGLFTYLWNFGDGNTAATQNPVHGYAGSGPYNVTLTVTSSNGCVDDTIKIMSGIYAQPHADFTVDSMQSCLGGTVHFTDISNAPNSLVTQWFWDFGDATTSTAQNPTKQYASPGTYTVKLYANSGAGCRSDTMTKSVTVNALPTANFNISLPGCEKAALTITDVSLPNSGTITQWTWNYGDGSNAVLGTGIPFTHVYATANTYNVALQVKTDKGCISTVLIKPIVVNVKPKAGFISPQICASDLAAFMDTSHVTPGNIAGWNWNFGDGGTSTTQNPNHSYAGPGNYTATLIAISNNGCRDTIGQSFIVNGAAPLANFTVQNANILCSSQMVSITNASTVDFGSLIRLEVYWDYTNDPTIKTTDNSPVNGRIYTHTYPEFGAPATKTYTIRYVVYSGTTCVNTLNKTVTLLATPTLQFDPVNAICSNVPVFQVTQAQLLNGLPGAGVFTGPGISPTGLFNPATAGAGLQTIRYTYTGANGCTNYKEQTIEVDPTPIAYAGPDKVVLQGGVVTLSPALTIGIPVTYLWTPPIGLSNPNVPGPGASPPVDMTYTLTVTSDKGCATSDQVFVKILLAPTIPNIFSPNGDGVHDRWEIAYLESYPGCTVDIYNRYGQLIYHSLGYSNPWDGTVSGKQVPVGTYYYIVDPKNGRSKMSGYVDVIR
jgi:gliding motility-associated-like protein